MRRTQPPPSPSIEAPVASTNESLSPTIATEKAVDVALGLIQLLA